MIMNGNTSKSLSAAGWLAVAALSLLLPLVPIQAQQPSDDRNDPRDQQIQQLRKALQALEEQQRAVQEKRAAESLHRASDALHRVKEQEAQAQNAEKKAREQLYLLRAHEAQLAQSQDAQQRIEHLRLRVADDRGNPDIQKAERVIEEITRAMEEKRRELRGLEEKLQHARVDLEKMRADGAQREAKRRIELRDAEIHREPLIIKIDPNVSPEQIKAQVEALQGKIKQPIRVEIVNPEGRIIRSRTEPVPEPRPREVEPRRDDRGREPRPRESRSGNLEERLEKIMKEVEELRRELRSSRPGPGGPAQP